MNIVLFGAGRIGLVSAVCYALFGHTVILVDIDEKKVEQIRSGSAPFLERELEERLVRSLASGSLRIESRLDDASGIDAFLICLPTPPLPNGETDLSYIRDAFISIHELMKKLHSSPPVIVRSTVPPESIRRLFNDYLSGAPLVLNPEFLREGVAIDDFLNPPFCIAGGDDPDAVESALKLYESIGCPKYRMSLESAALLKYGCNAFHALKITFANEIGRLAHQMGADGNEVMQILASDRKLNASSAYLKPGFAFGGPCLVKDLKSLLSMAETLNLELPLLENILVSNERHIEESIAAIVHRGAKRVGLIGVSFKPGTGDMRDSPYLELAKRLEAKQISVMLYDTELLDHTKNLQELIAFSDLLVLTQAALSPEDRKQLSISKLPILNLERIGAH